MSDDYLPQLVTLFNRRRFAAAAEIAAEALTVAQGRDEIFWQGLCDTCEGYADLAAGRLGDAEHKLVAAMQKLRNFGFQYRNFQITAALAGVRTAVAEIRTVQREHKRRFDVSLLPQLRLVAEADDA
jgi:hypothetical protein